MTDSTHVSNPLRRATLSRRQLLQVSAGGASTLALLGLVGCQPAMDPSTAPAAEGGESAATTPSVMTIGYDSDILKLDPGIQQAGVDWPPAALVYSRLVEYDNTMMNPIPGLAESWTVSEDGLTYTFQLRQGAKFHSGREITSDDVAYTFTRGFELGSQGRFLGYMLAVDTFEAPSPYEFVIHLKQVDVTFFPNLAVMSASIVDKETIAQVDTHPIGSGPYEFVEWVPGERVVYRKFPDYWDQEQLAQWPDEIVTIPIPETQTRIANLQSGQVDIATAIPPEFYEQITSDANLQLLGQEVSASYLCLIFSNERPPFQDNKLLRQAIARAIDKEAILQNVFFGSGESQCNLIPSTHWAYTELDCPTRDLDAARQLLAESGFDPATTITFRTFSEPGYGVPVAEIIQANLAEIGLTVVIEPLEWAFYVEDAWVGRNFEMTLASYTREIDPDGLFSSVLRKEQGNNPMRYFNEEVEALFDQAKATADPEERKALYAQLMDIAILDDTPLVKLKTMEIKWAANQKIEGLAILPKGYPNFYDWKWVG
ncbi:MAG: ABC transporter substrate-binding protein [Caldilineaceae bacterium]|nr:ABC transporter substrate-binding protein [Caldilineaceae bacterium]